MMREDRICVDYGMLYRTNMCFAAHMADGTCAKYYRCEKCDRSVRKVDRENNKHLKECGTSYCTVCRRRMPIGHTICYLFRNEEPELVTNTDTVYYDIGIIL